MKSEIASTDPWCGGNASEKDNQDSQSHESTGGFEDSFVENEEDSLSAKLADSEQYLAKLYSRLRALQGGTSKRDLVDSLSVVKEDTIARLITTRQYLEVEEESECASNPLIRHIAPHLQALTPSELVHLLKADVLQTVTSEQQEEPAPTNTSESTEIPIEIPPSPETSNSPPST